MKRVKKLYLISNDSVLNLGELSCPYMKFSLLQEYLDERCSLNVRSHRTQWHHCVLNQTTRISKEEKVGMCVIFSKNVKNTSMENRHISFIYRKAYFKRKSWKKEGTEKLLTLSEKRVRFSRFLNRASWNSSWRNKLNHQIQKPLKPQDRSILTRNCRIKKTEKKNVSSSSRRRVMRISPCWYTHYPRWRCSTLWTTHTRLRFR